MDLYKIAEVLKYILPTAIILVALKIFYVARKGNATYKGYVEEFNKAETVSIKYKGDTFDQKLIEKENLSNIIKDFTDSVKLNTENINTEVIIEKNIGFEVADIESQADGGGAVCIALGLLGTFIGLTISIIGASKAMEISTSMEVFVSSMKAPIEGMGVAFITTICGVVASLAINKEVRKLKIQKENFYNVYEGYLDNYIYSCYHKTDTENLANKFEESFNKMTECVEGSMGELVEEMATLFSDGVEKLVEKINVGNLDLKTSIDSLSGYSKELKRLTESLGDSVENFRNPVDRFKSSVEEYCGQSEEFTKAMENNVKKFTNSVDNAHESFSDLRGSIDGNKDEISKITKIINKQFKNLEEVSTELKDILRDFKGENAKQSDGVTQNIESLKKTYERFGKISNEFSDAISKIQSDNNKVLTQGIRSGVLQLSEEIVSNITPAVDSLEKTSKNLVEVSDNLSKMNSVNSEFFETLN